MRKFENANLISDTSRVVEGYLPRCLVFEEGYRIIYIISYLSKCSIINTCENY